VWDVLGGGGGCDGMSPTVLELKLYHSKTLSLKDFAQYTYKVL